VILFNLSRSVIEERDFNTEGTKKNSRKTGGARELFPALPLRVLRAEAHNDLMDKWLWGLCVKGS
jgi:hypothetical protein